MFAFDYGEDIESTLTVSTSSQSVSQQQITVDFENELKGVFTGLKPTSDAAKDLDFGFGPATPVDGQFVSQGIMIW